MKRTGKEYRFKRIVKGGRKGKRRVTKLVRVGATNPGASNKVGSIRHPV